MTLRNVDTGILSLILRLNVSITSAQKNTPSNKEWRVNGAPDFQRIAVLYGLQPTSHELL